MKKAAALLFLVFSAASHSQQYQFNVPRELHCTAKPYCGTPGRACKGVEKTYRVFVEQLPDKGGPAASGVRVLTRVGIPVYLEPPQPVASAEIASLAVAGRR